MLTRFTGKGMLSLPLLPTGTMLVLLCFLAASTADRPPLIETGMNNMYDQPVEPGKSIKITDGRIVYLGQKMSANECAQALNSTYFSFIWCVFSH